MSSFQDLLKGVSTYFEQRSRTKAANLELTGSSTKRRSKGQREIEKKKEIQKIKGMMGELQRAELVRPSTIETDFFKKTLEDFIGKKQETQTRQEEARSGFEQVRQEYERKMQELSVGPGAIFNPYRTKYEKYAETLKDPNKVLDLFKQKNEMQQAGYHSAARFMQREWKNMESPLYKAYLKANEIKKQGELSNYYTTQATNTQRSLDIASQTAVVQAEAQAVPLQSIRQQTIDTLGREIIDRGGTTNTTTSLATETKEGPTKKTTTTSRVKDKLRRIEQPSFYETRPQ